MFYGAAEFSRDTDLVILADARNLARLRRALTDLEAGVVAVPPLRLEHLRRGHAVHFRCRHPDAFHMRVDVMSRPMIRRLVEAHYFEHREHPTPAHVRFWLREFRTPELLVEAARTHRARCLRLARQRPLLEDAAAGRVAAVERALSKEEAEERQSDRQYWLPLRRELEHLRHRRVAPSMAAPRRRRSRTNG